MKKNCFYIFACFMMLVGLGSCTFSNEEEKVAQTAEAFAKSCADYDFDTAVKYVTPTSMKWISLIASNMTQSDVDMLRSMEDGASISIGDISIKGDSVAHVSATVENVLVPQGFAEESIIAEKAQLTLRLVQQNGKWLVDLQSVPRMEVLQQSERQNPDQNQD